MRRLLQAGFKVGERISVRPANKDELFYPCTVIGVETRMVGGKKKEQQEEEEVLKVRYEDDGTVEEGIKASLAIAETQDVVHEAGDIAVVDGHCLVTITKEEKEQAAGALAKTKQRIQRARLLVFRPSGRIVQSAVLLKESVILSPTAGAGGVSVGEANTKEKSTTAAIAAAMAASDKTKDITANEKKITLSPDFSTIVFDVNQALALSVPIILFYIRRLLRPKGSSRKKQKIPEMKGCILGGGAFTLPSSLSYLFSPSLFLDVVELNPEVISIAKKYFGALSFGESTMIHQLDAMKFLQRAKVLEKRYDFIVIDIASHDGEVIKGETENGWIDLPPCAFLQESFLSDIVIPCLEPAHGVLVVNVIADTKALRILVERFEMIFNSVQCFLMDPNIVFYLSHRDRDTEITASELLQTIESIKGCEKLCPALTGVLRFQRDQEELDKEEGSSPAVTQLGGFFSTKMLTFGGGSSD